MRRGELPAWLKNTSQYRFGSVLETVTNGVAYVDKPADMVINILTSNGHRDTDNV